MNQSTNYKHKIEFLITNSECLIQPTQNIVKSKYKKKKCNHCNKRRKTLDESHQICHICYKLKTKYNPKQSGNKVIDDFIKYTQTNLIKKEGKMDFVPYEQFKNIEFIAEGGFSKIYKATWIDGPISNWNFLANTETMARKKNYTVVLKKLNNSNNITSKELNELRIFYNYYTKSKTQSEKYRKTNSKFNRPYSICEYFGITQDPNTLEIMIIMPYYASGDLVHYINNDFYNISWYDKLYNLHKIISELALIHGVEIIHRDFHSGNIFFDENVAYVGDLGLSKSATESADDNNENYGIIPYMAPEIFQGQKYTKASDIYSFGMIMWEFMTGRRPFWDQNHDTYLIIKICDGIRPPIVTNAPEGYIELMKECWHSDPEKRPTAIQIYDKINNMFNGENRAQYENPTKIVPSSDIGPIEINNPGAIYKSRPLSGMIHSAMSLRSLRSQCINLETVKRKLKDNLIDDNDNGQSVKRKKFFENENSDYLTKENEFDIDMNFNNNEYLTKENDFDII